MTRAIRSSTPRFGSLLPSSTSRSSTRYSRSSSFASTRAAAIVRTRSARSPGSGHAIIAEGVPTPAATLTLPLGGVSAGSCWLRRAGMSVHRADRVHHEPYEGVCRHRPGDDERQVRGDGVRRDELAHLRCGQRGDRLGRGVEAALARVAIRLEGVTQRALDRPRCARDLVADLALCVGEVLRVDLRGAALQSLRLVDQDLVQVVDRRRRFELGLRFAG